MKNALSILFILGLLRAQELAREDRDLLKWAVAYYQRGEWNEAIKIIEDALPNLEIEERFEAHKYLGMSYARLNNNISAKEHFKILLKLNPKFALNSVDADPLRVKLLNDAKKEIAYESAF
jgi:tetratricopeptide (TPR) repeat protein|uniref:Tetratricopeptide repeat protein n=1 Tax=candidate division WOR-3 bacterium TaxID=2052148 RepID=A0A7V3VUL2_UNCW3